MAVAIIGERFVWGNGVFRKSIRPIKPFLLVGVIFQAELKVLFAAATEDVDMTGSVGIAGTDGGRFRQNLFPKNLV